MKKFKFTILLVMILLMTGCVNADMNIEINNDDSGQIIYLMGIDKQFIESSGEATYKFNEIVNEKISVEELEYNKDEKTYIGRKAIASFKSLDELNEILKSLNNSTSEDVNTQSLEFMRNNEEVILKLEKSETSEQDISDLSNFIDYSIKIKVAGEILEQNADEYNITDGTLTWNFSTMYKEGIELKYKTSNEERTNKNSGNKKTDVTDEKKILYLSIVGGLNVAAIIGLIVFKIKQKQA